MDITKLLQMGATMFMNSRQSGDAGSNLEINNLTSAISNLFSGDLGKGGLDLGSLLSKMDSGGLGDIAKSWLGDGNNESIMPDQISNLFGADKISDFASKLGLSNQEAAGGLADAIPNIIDKASSGGSLLDSIGGVSGALGVAGKLFGK